MCDHDKHNLVAKAFENVLVGAGFDLSGSRKDTPTRYAKFICGAATPPPLDFKVFEEDEVSDGLLVQDGIFFSSLCEHHVLPFFGTVSIGYVHFNGRICGLSKLARVVNHFAAGLQVQERITHRLGKFLFEQSDLKPAGIGVSVRAYHTCMIARGVRQPTTVTTTQSLFGAVKNDSDLRQEFLQRICHPNLF